MSAASTTGGDADGGVARVRPGVGLLRRPGTRFLRSELWLIFGRRRNWAGLAVLAVVPIVVAIVIKVSPPSATGVGGPDFFREITSNGLFVALSSLSMELPLFLPLAVAAIASDSIAGEANVGTLRYLLAVPVTRTRMLVVKYLGIVVFSFAATLVVAGVGTLIGLALFGGGDATSLSGTSLPFWSAALRVFAVCCYLTVQLSALGAIGLFASSLTEQPIGATIAVMVLTVLSFILDSLTQLSWLHPYLFSHYWLAFGDLLRDPVVFDGPLRSGLLAAAAYTAVFWTAAWARFNGRDITS